MILGRLATSSSTLEFPAEMDADEIAGTIQTRITKVGEEHEDEFQNRNTI
jgi:hypothetical protein